MDWATFFVCEFPPKTTDSGHTRYPTTWTAYSSFGVFGHCWADMGCPFAEFIARVDQGYVLGKIARRVFDEARFLKWLNRAIFTSRCTKEEKAEAHRALKELRLDWSSEALWIMAYNDPAISRVHADWSDCDAHGFDPQAVGFYKAFWPKFVEAMREAA